MNKKSFIYLITGILGLALIVSAIVLEGRIPDALDGILIGVGAGITGLGVSGWCFCHWVRREPEKWKQYETEAGDERNVAIQNVKNEFAEEPEIWEGVTGKQLSACFV